MMKIRILVGDYNIGQSNSQYLRHFLPMNNRLKIKVDIYKRCLKALPRNPVRLINYKTLAEPPCMRKGCSASIAACT